MKNIILALCFLALLAGVGYYMTKSNTQTISEMPSQSANIKDPLEGKPSVTLSKEAPQQPQQQSQTASSQDTQNNAEQVLAQNTNDKAPEQNSSIPEQANNQAQAEPQNANQTQSAEQNAPEQVAQVEQKEPKAEEPKATEAPKEELKEEPKPEEPKATETPKEEPKADTAKAKDGIEIDTSGARINFVSYKMANKMKVPEAGGPATFKEVEFNFANTSGSVAKILMNSTAKINLNSIDTNKNAIRDNNVKNKFFANLTSQEVSAKIVSVSGNNEAGQIAISLNLNGVEKNVTLKYEVKDGKLTATGEIDLVEGNLFNTAEAFEKFASEPVIQGLHGKKSWSDIQIGFEVPVK